MGSQIGGGQYIFPPQQPVQWRYSMQSNGVSLATFDGDVAIAGNLGGNARTRLTGNVAVSVNYQTGSDAVTVAQFLAGSPARSFARANAIIRDFVDFAGYRITLTATSSAPVTEALIMQGGYVGLPDAASFVVDYSTCDLTNALLPNIAVIGVIPVTVKTQSIANTSPYAAVQSYPKGADIRLEPGDFKACTNGHMQAAGGEIRIGTAYSVTGDATVHGVAEVGSGLIDLNGATVSIIGARTFSLCFLNAGEGGGNIGIHSTVWNTAAGSVVGKPFIVTDGGAISPYSKIMSIPGNQVGTIDTAQRERGQLFGYTLSNNVADAANDIDFAAGTCVDSTGSLFIRTTTGLTKRLDAAWAAGNNQGGLDTGAIGNNTYHCFAILANATGEVDFLFSLSPTAPTMPAGYTAFRRIGSIIRSAGAILAFKHNCDEFRLATSVLDYSGIPGVTTTASQALTVPTGIVVYPHIGCAIVSGATTDSGVLLSALDETDSACDASNATSFIQTGSTNGPMCREFKVKTNTSAQIRRRTNQADSLVRIRTYGWTDHRDRLAA
jgi:hypothetical protein